MKNIILRTAVIIITICTCLAGYATFTESTPTDITALYITNASFEADDITSLSAVNNSADGLRGYTLNTPTGWTVSGADVTKLLVTSNCFTDNNFGLVTSISEGSKAYYLRMGWSTGTTILQQTIKDLPAGNYMLTADIRAAYANSATSSYTLFAGNNKFTGAFTQGSNGCMPSLEWTTAKCTFEKKEKGDVNIGISVDWLSGGSCILIDNVKLYQLDDEFIEPQDPTESEVKSGTEGVITNEFVSELT